MSCYYYYCTLYIFIRVVVLMYISTYIWWIYNICILILRLYLDSSGPTKTVWSVFRREIIGRRFGTMRFGFFSLTLRPPTTNPLHIRQTDGTIFHKRQTILYVYTYICCYYYIVRRDNKQSAFYFLRLCIKYTYNTIYSYSRLETIIQGFSVPCVCVCVDHMRRLTGIWREVLYIVLYIYI